MEECRSNPAEILLMILGALSLVTVGFMLAWAWAIERQGKP